MKIEVRLLKSETIKDLIRHNQRSEEKPSRPSAVDVHGTTCVHEHFIGSGKCGRSIPKDAPHGWLCSLHLNEKWISTEKKGVTPKVVQSV